MPDEITYETIDQAETQEELEGLLEQTMGGEAGEENAPEPNVSPEAHVDPDPNKEGETQPTIEERLAELEKLNTKLTKRVQDKDDYIQRRDAEIGNLRKTIRDKELNDIPTDVDIDSLEFAENPAAAVEKIVEARKRKEKLLDDEQNQRMTEAVNQSRKLIQEVDPDFDDRVPEILALLRADKAPDHIVSDFERQPHAMFNPAVTLQLIKRAQLTKENAELRAKLEEAQGKPKKIVENVKRYQNHTSKVTTSPPSKSPPKGRLAGMTEKDLDRMSYEELQALEDELINR